MTTAFTATHRHHTILKTTTSTAIRNRTRGKLSVFFSDLLEDLRQRPLQAAHLAKHDMFREHINAMAICYFALILLLIAGSLPVLAYLIAYGGL